MKIFLDRYAKRDKNTNQPIEKSPVEMWDRVAKHIASAEATPELQDLWYKNFLDALTDFRFIPGGRIMSGSDSGQDSNKMNCYFFSIEDTRESIFQENLWKGLDIAAKGGGVGYNFSKLRPKGTPTKKVGGIASGPVSFMRAYNECFKQVSQGGSRRAALLATLDISHPDVFEFIHAKDNGGLEFFNISLVPTQEFWDALDKDSDFDLKWNGTVYRTVKAKQLWEELGQSAWTSGDPGLQNIETGNKYNSVWYLPEQKLQGSNPCGEVQLPHDGVCNLGSINLSTLIESGEFNFRELTKLTSVGVRFLDNALTVNKFPFPEIEKVSLQTRRIGLGVTGLADVLIKLKIRYGSKESIALCEQIAKTIRDSAYLTSAKLAKEKGPFSGWSSEKFLSQGFSTTLPEAIRDVLRIHGLRNYHLLSIAPTGTLSQLAQVWHSIEPVFAFEFERHDGLGKNIIRHPLMAEWIKDNPGQMVPDYFVAAHELTPDEHLNVQIAFQKYFDNAISKTINMPNNSTPEDILMIYRKAMNNDCRGITVFRDGCKTGVMNLTNTKQEAPKLALLKRPFTLKSQTYKLKLNAKQTFYVTIAEDESGKPFEIFVQSKDCTHQAYLTAITRLISAIFRRTDDHSFIVEQLRSIRDVSNESLFWGGKEVKSIPAAIALVLEYHLTKDKNPKYLSMSKCPECDNMTIVKDGRCSACLTCGYSACDK